MAHKTLLQRMRAFLITSVMGGLVVVLPVTIFIWLIRTVVRAVARILDPVEHVLSLPEGWAAWVVDLTAFGITLAIGLSAFVNIAVVTNLLPTTGIPLPFVSYGGSSLIVHLAAIGVLLNISQSMQPKKAGGVTKIPLARTKWYRDRKR